MRPRGWIAATVVAAVAAVGVAWGPFTSAQGTVPGSTLTLEIPGPFTGCSVLSGATNESLRAVLDLVRPSAFTTTQYGVLVGESGPIADAELTSLAPQTVTYTVAPGWVWSTGAPFDADDLLRWFQTARRQVGPLADGYRAIGSLTASADQTQVTAVFTSPFANWASLFRDVNERASPATCTLAGLAREPSLGPYELTSLSPTRAVLARDPNWLGTRARFAHLIVLATTTPLPLADGLVVDYQVAPPPDDVATLADSAHLAGHVGTSDQLLAVAFSPRGPLTAQLAVRQFLGLLINRQRLIDAVVGAVSYRPGLADSALYPQGEHAYPGSRGVGPIDQGPLPAPTTVPTVANEDCVTCATPLLTAAGYVRGPTGWRSPSGAPLALRVAVGSDPLDRAVAARVLSAWRAAGVRITSVTTATDAAVARELARGTVDAGIVTDNLGSEPFLAARTWSASVVGDVGSVGWRSPLVDQWYATAQDTFNPVDAESDYTEIDQYITSQEWERPLFTEPSVLMWTRKVTGVVTSDTLIGIVDQAPTWGLKHHKQQS